MVKCCVSWGRALLCFASHLIRAPSDKHREPLGRPSSRLPSDSHCEQRREENVKSGNGRKDKVRSKPQKKAEKRIRFCDKKNKVKDKKRKIENDFMRIFIQ